MNLTQLCTNFVLVWVSNAMSTLTCDTIGLPLGEQCHSDVATPWIFHISCHAPYLTTGYHTIGLTLGKQCHTQLKFSCCSIGLILGQQCRTLFCHPLDLPYKFPHPLSHYWLPHHLSHSRQAVPHLLCNNFYCHTFITLMSQICYHNIVITRWPRCKTKQSSPCRSPQGEK